MRKLSGPDRVADHCFQFLRSDFPDIAQVDLVVQTLICDIQRITLFLHTVTMDGLPAGI